MDRQEIRPKACATKNTSFVLAGRTTGGRFAIYNLRYRFLTHPGGVYHGDQRIIVFRGKKYLGQYYVQPVVSVAVRGNHVVLKGDDDRTAVELDFSKAPPNEILVNGEIEEFSR